MQIKDIMTTQTDFCTPNTSPQSVARKMAQRHCGAIGVVENTKSMRPVGVVTEGDITTRVVAEGQNPRNVRARDCISEPVVTVGRDTDVAECISIFQDKAVRGIPVVDENGQYCGIVEQDDVLRSDVMRDIPMARGQPQEASEDVLLRLYF